MEQRCLFQPQIDLSTSSLAVIQAASGIETATSGTQTTRHNLHFMFHATLWLVKLNFVFYTVGAAQVDVFARLYNEFCARAEKQEDEAVCNILFSYQSFPTRLLM